MKEGKDASPANTISLEGLAEEKPASSLESSPISSTLRFQEIPYLPLLEHKSYIYLYKEYAAENQRFSVQGTFSSSFGSQYKLETNGAYQRSQ